MKSTQINSLRLRDAPRKSPEPIDRCDRNFPPTKAAGQTESPLALVEPRLLTDLAEKEAEKFANKMDRLLKTYNPIELENRIFWRVLTRNLEATLEVVKNRIPELRTEGVGYREAIPSFKPQDHF
jgi:hypothetical protein